MRKSSLILEILVFLLGGTIAADICQGQSTFAFRNFSPNAPVYDANGNPLYGANYVAVLYGGTSASSLLLATLPSAYTQPMQPVAFTLSPGFFNLSGGVGIPSVAGGGGAFLQVRAWDIRLGSSYEAVANLGVGGYGESDVFFAFGGDPNAGTPIPPQPLQGLQSFSLRPNVPEPSAGVLLFLASALCLIKRCLSVAQGNNLNCHHCN